MSGAVAVAIAAAIGNLLQGWDNATIAGSILYIKKEFGLEDKPTIEGLIVAMSLIGAALITTCSGAIADWLGRRPLLIVSSVFYLISALVMLWSPNVYVLLFARLLYGFGIGLAVTFTPVYISEMAPPDIRGLLNTLPQLTGSLGMFSSYCIVFGMSLSSSPSWRLMLGVLFIPSLFYLALTVFCLPESPRWLVSKGRTLEAKKVLQRLRGREDVLGEMALLVEGLVIGGEASVEEYVIGPAQEQELDIHQEQIRLQSPEEGTSWIARPATGQSFLHGASRPGSIVTKNLPLMDPVVTLFGSIHEKIPDAGSKGSMLFPHLGSMFSVAGNQPPNIDDWDEEIHTREGDDDDGTAEVIVVESDDNLQSPLISRQTTSMENDTVPQPPSHGSIFSIGGGWKLAWKWTEREVPEGNKEAGFQRIYLHGTQRDEMPSAGEYLRAAALVSAPPASYLKEIIDQHPIGPAIIHPTEAATNRPKWSGLFEPGVRHALIIGVGIQILQQFSGINGVMYYTPQILEQAGVEVLLSNMGISSASAYLLICAIIYLLMLPCIAVAMRLMDLSGRRGLLLGTIPILIATLITLVVIGSVVNVGSIAKATISTVCVVVYLGSFVTGFGPIPNILCSEIFPTRVRGICVAISAITFWIADIILTYSLPLILSSIGLAGVFGIYAAVCVISWGFVFLRVPETKGMPLEVIADLFALAAKQAAAPAN